MKTKLLLFLTFILFSFGQLARISLLNQEINMYAYELFVVLGLLFFFVQYRLQPLKEAFKTHKLIFVFLSSLLVSFILSAANYSLYQNSISILYFVRLVCYLTYFVYLTHYIKMQKHSQFFNRAIWVMLTMTIISSFIQFFFYPDLQNLIYLGWDPHYHRMFGVFFDTSVATTFFGLSFLYILASSSISKKKNNLIYIVSLGFLVALVLTFSRSGYIAMFIALFYLFGSMKVFRYAFFILLLFIFLLIVVPKQFGQGVGLSRTFSISSRIGDYQQGVKIWSKHPIFGVGYNRLRYVRERLNLINIPLIPSHAAASLSSSYLVILICGGLVGLTLFVTSIFQLLKSHKTITTLILFVAILSIFDNMFLHPFILFLLGSFICGLNLSYMSRK